MVDKEHIVGEEEGLVYYSPLIFHKNRYHGVKVPILVVDVLELVKRSKDVCKAYYGNMYNGLLYGNHPLEKVTIMGMVVGCRYKYIGDDGYLLIKLDDCSGSGIFVQCKCLESLANNFGIYWESIDGQKLKLQGSFNLWYCELEVNEIEYVADMIGEIEHWEVSIKYRRKLSVPWIEPTTVKRKPVSYIQRLRAANVAAPPPRVPGLKKEFLRALLRQESEKVHTVELLDDISSVLENRKFQKLKSEVLFEQLCKLHKSGLILCYPNDNAVDLRPLKTLHQYSMHRLSTLIKLQCNTGRIDYEYIREKLNHGQFTDKAIIDVFNESLRVIARYGRLLSSWWIDTDCREFSVIHFKYRSDDTPRKVNRTPEYVDLIQ